MTKHTGSVPRRSPVFALGDALLDRLIWAAPARTLLALLSVLLLAAPASAQTGELPPPSSEIGPGDIAVSGFSGTALSAESLAPGVDPVDKTVIDVEGSALRVLALPALGGAPAGQLVDPLVKFIVPAKDIGQVFGLAFDSGTGGGAPNLYAGASSAYGIQIVSSQPDSEGKPVRLKSGAPDARFMDGQFGGLPGASPGTIWKIDGATGEATVAADTAFSGVANSGPGLGGLAFDPRSRNLYAADLDTGLIHRFAVDYNGADLGQFDHGVTGRPARDLDPVPDDGKAMDIFSPDFKPADIATWGLSQPERRVDGLAVHDGRLYYAVADGPEIWSVALNPDGSFGEDVRSELLVAANGPVTVTDIAFDNQGRMLLAERGAQKSPYDYGQLVEAGSGAQALRYVREEPNEPATPSIWAPVPQSFAVGFPENGNMASGGVALQYGYAADGTLDPNACRGTLAATADGLSPEGTVHGIQFNDAELVVPDNLPPQQSVFVDYDSRQDNAELLGHVGGVAVFADCQPGAGEPPVAEGGGNPPVVGPGGGAPRVVGAGLPPVVGTGPPVVGAPPVIGAPPPGVPGGPASGGLRITKSAVSVDCDEKKKCTYEIDLVNTSALPIGGPIAIEDTLSAGGAPLPDAVIVGTQNPPWTCEIVAGKFTCVHPGPIPPDATAKLILNFLPGPLGGATEVKNCAALVPLPTTPGPIPPPKASDAGGVKVELKPVSASCQRASGECTWNTVVTNTGTAALNQTVIVRQSLEVATPAEPKFGESAPAMVGTVGGTPGWDCRKEVKATSNFICFLSKPTLNPNDSVTLSMTYKLADPRFIPAPFVKDTALVSFGEPVGGAVPAGARDAGQAEASIPFDPPIGDAKPPPSVNDPPPQPTPFDPNFPNFVTLENVVGKCSPQTGNCALDVVMTNRFGTDVVPNLTGQLYFSDTVKVGWTSPSTMTPVNVTLLGTPTDGWSCVKEKAGASGEMIGCVRPNTTLAPGAKITFPLKLKFDVAPGMSASFVNNRVLMDFKGNASVTKVAEVPILLDPPIGNAKPANAGGGGAPGAGSGGAPGPGAPGAGGGQGAGPIAPTAPVCAVIAVVTTPPPPPPAPSPNQAQAGVLTIEKKARLSSCKNGRSCDFDITVTNTGTVPFNGPVEFDDTVTGDGAFFGTTDIGNGPTPPWTCTKAGQGFRCANPNVSLPTNGKTSILIGFDLGAGIGAVKEMKNCALLKGAAAPACDTIPLTPQSGPLTITKQAKASPCSVAGGCAFDMIVTNTSGKEFKGPIEIDDALSGDGTALGKASIVAGPNPPWTCAKAAIGVNCMHPETTLAANASVPLQLEFQPGALVKTVRNCATLKGGGVACAETQMQQPGQPQPPQPPQAQLKVEKKATANSCFPEGPCSFAITVTNSGTVAFVGPITLEDILKGGDGAALASVELSGPPPTAPWTCSKAGQFFLCALPTTTLAPGASTTLNLGFKPGTTPAGQKLENCAGLQGGGTPSCATIGVFSAPVEVPLPAPNSAVTTTALQPTCALKGPCPFEVRVMNMGNGPFMGKVAVVNTFFSGDGPGKFSGTVTQTMKGSVQWICSPDGPMTQTKCQHPNANQTVKPSVGNFFNVEVFPGEEWAKNNILQLCAHVSYDQPNNDPGTIKTDDDSCASMRLDPFALEITKTGGESCQPGGECRFDLEIFNPGPILHDDPVAVVDNLSGLAGAPILSIMPVGGAQPFPCVPVPTQVPFGCSGHMRLEIGERSKYTMTLRLPAEAPASGSFTNCASVSDPKLPSAVADAASCQEVKLVPTCTAGMVPTKNGRCACPPGQKWDGRICAVPSEAACPIGTTGNYPDCKTPPPPPSPPMPGGGSNTSKSGPTNLCPPSKPNGVYPNCCVKGLQFIKGACRCPTGTVLKLGACVALPKACPANRPVGAFPNCCPKGTVFEKGACRQIVKTPKACSADRPVGTPPNCCPEGTVFRKGACRPVATAPQTCPPDRPVGNPPNCCPEGTVFRKGACRPTACPPGTFGVPPLCVKQKEEQPQERECPPGYRTLPKPNKYGASCEPIEEAPAPPPPPAQCKFGMIGTPPSDCHCPAGTEFMGYKGCVKIEAPPPPPPPPEEPPPDYGGCAKCGQDQSGPIVK